MLWLGFRHTHAFVRVRLHTREVVTPGETREDAGGTPGSMSDGPFFWMPSPRWGCRLKRRSRRGVAAEPADPATPFFCSWPDAFGPSQFEYNSADAYEFLVPASKLRPTFAPQPANVRAYMTGFAAETLEQFGAIQPVCPLCVSLLRSLRAGRIARILAVIEPEGRLYSTLCEFNTQELLPEGEEASAIVGDRRQRGRFSAGNAVEPGSVA